VISLTYKKTILRSVHSIGWLLWLCFYLDDILIYSKLVKEHAQLLEYVLQKFHDNKSYANKMKGEFIKLEMDFLGNILS
jgi:hypothetical protein